MMVYNTWNYKVSFDISLFTNVPVDEALQVIRSKLHNDDTLLVKIIMEWLEVCLRTTYFQVNKLFQQKTGMAMASSLLPIVSNIFMEHFEELALESVQYKPSLWLWYIGETFVVWPHGKQQLQSFLSQINSVRPSIQFTREMKSQSAIPFLNLLVIRKEMTLAIKVHREPTHTGRYLNFKPNYPLHVKSGLIQSLHNRDSTSSQE
jgi:hypothetical protein